MKEHELEHRIKELEIELNYFKSFNFDAQKSNQSDPRFRNLVEQSIGPVLLLKGENMILDIANAPLFKIFRIGKEALGKPFLDIVPEMKDHLLMGLLLDVLHNHTFHYVKEQPAYFVSEHGEKETVYFNFELHPYKEDDGTISGVIVDATDVTEQVLFRKKTEEIEYLFKSLVYTSPSMIAIFKGKDMMIEIANDAILESWGKGKNVIGKSLFEVVPEVVEQGFDKLIQSVYKTGIPLHAYEIPVTIMRKGTSELLHYSFTYQAQRNVDGEIVGVAVLANEVTPQVEAKIKIKESEERFRTLADNMPLNVFIIEPTPEANITYWNKYWLDYTGQTIEEALGRAWDGIIHPEDVQPIMDVYIAAFESRQPYYLPAIRIKRFDGEYRWFAVQVNPRFLSNGEFMGFIGVGFDIHEQKLVETVLKQSEAHFRRLADLMPAKISNASVDGSVTYFNKHWLDFSGYTFEELRDFGYHQMMHPDEITEFRSRFQHAAATSTDLVMEMRFKNTDGDYIWHLNIASPIKDDDGNHQMWVGVTTDISEQIKTRDTNLGIYEKYANELKHAKDLAELATARAETAVKSKQQFLSNMSHEIRTPLNSIVGFTNVLFKTELDEKQKDFVHAIKTSSNSLSLLINDILDLAKADAGKVTFESKPFEIHKSIKSIRHSFDLKIREKNLELISEYDSKIPTIVVGDSAKLNQIILNLMSNAIKFTHKGKITLSTKLQSEDEKKVYIEFAVTDSGIGINEGKLDSIFNLFEQAEIGTSNLYGGTGLGLAIVKQLVEFQGGCIHVKSKIDKGSTFSFILPFGKTDMKIIEEVEILKLDPTIKNLRVLVAEDVVLNQLLIKIILSDFGFEHEVAENGRIAIEKLKTNTYDIILMDLQMPEMNGFDATEYIRKTMKLNVPIIALTADVTTVDIAKCIEFGMDDYISKPVDENQLYSKIVELIKNK
jgi:PAS domain S-box-containing protein